MQTIPGIDQTGAAMLLMEISTDMDSFGSAEKLATWVGICPGNNESAGKRKSGKTRKGNAWVRRLLCEFAQAALSDAFARQNGNHRNAGCQHSCGFALCEDDAELRLTQKLQRMGQEAMQAWVITQFIACEQDVRHTGRAHREGKKLCWQTTFGDISVQEPQYRSGNKKIRPSAQSTQVTTRGWWGPENAEHMLALSVCRANRE